MPKGQRQFKLELITEGKQGFANLTNKSGNAWSLNKDLFQEIEASKLTNLFEESNKKSIYKLVLNNVWEQGTKVDFEGQGIKGALGLIKATWNGKKLGEKEGWEIEKIDINDKTKVWLIVAKSKGAMYLMPVVRNLNKCGFLGERIEDSQGKLRTERVVNEKGVEKIKEWTQIYDNGRGWDKNDDEKLQRKMSEGFSVTRKAEIAVFSEDKVVYEWSRAAEGKEIKEIRKGGNKSIGNLYRNAGILNLTGINNNSKSCNEIEHYFPLDLVVLGNITVIRGDEEENLIEIFDGIKEVIGVRLDQVVISK